MHCIVPVPLQSGVQFQAIVVDSRPHCEGKQMLRKLLHHGIPASYCLINSLSYIMQVRRTMHHLGTGKKRRAKTSVQSTLLALLGTGLQIINVDICLWLVLYNSAVQSLRVGALQDCQCP